MLGSAISRNPLGQNRHGKWYQTREIVLDVGNRDNKEGLKEANNNGPCYSISDMKIDFSIGKIPWVNFERIVTPYLWVFMVTYSLEFSSKRICW